MPLARIQAAIVRNLKDYNRLTEEQAENIINTDEELSGEEVEALLGQDYGISEFQLLAAKSKAFGMAPFNAFHYEPDERTFEKLDKEFCEEHMVLPVGIVGSIFVVAVHNPFDLTVLNLVQEQTRRKVAPLLGIKREIQAKLKMGEEDQPVVAEGFGDVVDALDMEFDIDEEKLDDEGDAEDSAPIIQLANRIIEDAYYSGGSDIHIEPFEKDCRIRVRIDGVLQEKLNVSSKVAGALLARLKIMANLDIAEKRLPQDGRIVFKQFTRKPINIDLRVSTAPLNHGEGTVMRILDKSKSTLPLPALGFEPENLERYRECISRPYGMILHCGPTGSGKSMTLYSALNEINDPGICIRTAEDPIEYTLPGLCQMQMHRKIGLTFAAALRAFLRQDPDVILVGEIRDSETAGIAVEAALTGHMLFSTLHTNDAPGTVARLTEMGVEPFMISASLVAVCAQRLMRRVCKSCRQPYEAEGRELEILRKSIQFEGGGIFKANRTGCPACGGKGYKGRVGIHEMMTSSEALIESINKEAETAELKRVAMFNGMFTLHMDSMKKVRSGLTTMEEAISTVPPDMEDLEALSEEFELQAKLKNKKDAERKKEIEALRAEAIALENEDKAKEDATALEATEEAPAS
ncbi:GspE/PulE family protein [Cerasicoccus maritimus]|uniref:GspE/PulE family protein n=1 Tax=Cerasicoccus maritimus TaxID=490089 RepID=UPI002852AA1F|nr:GspE/PulE family protein [Cerasicoccus maritimus]